MKNIEWINIDKTDWEDGPWKNEPDKKQWVDEETGLPCLILRGHHGSLCGYVGVSENHKFYGKDYDKVPNMECHGGLSFAGGCEKGNDPGKGICHLPDEGEPDKTWWLGFDCGHVFDISPAYEYTLSMDAIYRDIKYVEENCRDLAFQIKASS